MPEEPPAGNQAPQSPLVRVVMSNGKVGYAAPEFLSPTAFDQLCYMAGTIAARIGILGRFVELASWLRLEYCRLLRERIYALPRLLLARLSALTASAVHRMTAAKGSSRSDTSRRTTTGRHDVLHPG
jgi:hypothetical protein